VARFGHFFISEDGKIMTAAHVVQTAFDVEVIFSNVEVVPARILGSEPAADAAVNMGNSGGFEGLSFVTSIKTAKEPLIDQRSFWGGMEGLVLEDAYRKIREYLVSLNTGDVLSIQVLRAGVDRTLELRVDR
jgi:S1-C subfamily serine protease